MCGIAGVFAMRRAERPPEDGEALAMREHMRARGPDGAGLWRSPDGAALLAHRRLAIIDLSTRAEQPMRSDDGRYVISFNGEIYNHRELRAELEARGARYRTTSDTETLLHLYAHEGEAMLPRLRGMFAFALYDVDARRLLLARDPYGIKPLYYADDGRTFRFASQVKALIASGVDDALDPAGLAGFCLLGSVPEPFTIRKAVAALPAGCSLVVDADGARAPRPFARISEIFAAPRSKENAVASVHAALRDSVRAHLLADVEVGLFLSAGVDSGALLGLMRDENARRVRAITLRFEEFIGDPLDEAPRARELAEYYGAEHLVRTVTRAEFDAVAPQIAEAMDQPTIDGVNVFFVAKAARELGLKVALSGVGGDELFAGYSTFTTVPRLARASFLPARAPGLGRALRVILHALAPELTRENPKFASVVEYGGDMPHAYFLRRGLYLPHELAELLGPDLAREGLSRLNLFALLRGAMTPDPNDSLRRIGALESAVYLRNQLLRDADWAGMAHSLEIRTPLVDTQLLRTLAPFAPTFAQGAGKALLASAPSRPLPPHIVARAKSGFAVPTHAWTDSVEPVRNASRRRATRILRDYGLSTCNHSPPVAS